MGLAFAGLITVAPATRADHNTIPWLALGDVSSNGGFNRDLPVMLTGPNGAVYEFYYTRSTVTGATNINVTKATAGGFVGLPTFDFDTQVNDVGNQNLVSPSYPFSAAMDHSGNIFVAWTRVPFGGALNEVYVSKSTDGGRTWDVAVPVRAGSALYSDLWPSIGTGPGGTVDVAWTQLYAPWANITFARSTDGGSTFSGVMNISGQGPRGLAEISTLAVDTGGRIFVGYTGLSPGYYSANLTWSDDGVTWSAPTQLTPKSTFAEFPQVVADSAGRVHVAWWDARGISAVGVPQFYYTRSSDRGTTWSVPLPITSGVVYPNDFASLAVHGDTVILGFSSTGELAYVISPDGGATWYPEETFYPGFSVDWASLAADVNDTFYAGMTDTSGTTNAAALLIWNGPPSTPTGVAVTASGTTGFTVSWTASPEPNVVEYQVWRSVDGGVSYTLAGTVSAGTTSYTDTGLANGAYLYEVNAVNVHGTPSHDSLPVSGIIGPSIAQLQQEITNLQNQIAALKGTADANNQTLAQLENQLANLQSQLNTLQGQQATQTMSYATLAFEIIVVVLLVVLLLNQMRKPKNPTLMMAQPGQAAQTPPSKPEDEL